MFYYFLFTLILAVTTAEAQNSDYTTKFYNQIMGPIIQQMQKAQNCNPDNLLRMTASPFSVAETIKRITTVLQKKNLQIYPTQFSSNQQVAFTSGEQVIIMFGKSIEKNLANNQMPASVSPLLPLRVMVGKTSLNQTYIAYVVPSNFPKCYDLKLPPGTDLQQLDQLLQNIVSEALALPQGAKGSSTHITH